eukprot:GFUD01002509.1.p1 GENE.GFUD01002509.1~~GFUD01002509.1.p1  ORF type:complete len:237 (+),score=30.94 GFUD01002509.1:173-883(+)
MRNYGSVRYAGLQNVAPVASPHTGYRSRFYTQEEKDDFLQEVELGDLIEFERRQGLTGYSHWAVWIGSGDRMIRNNGGAVRAPDDLVCHRGAPNGYNPSNLSSRSDVFSKSERGVGNIYFTRLANVVDGSVFRINNIKDYESGILFDGEEILNRCLEAQSSPISGYHLFDNNCEHFVRWARNDKPDSWQSQECRNCLSLPLMILVVIVVVLLLGLIVFLHCMYIHNHPGSEFGKCK